MSDRLASAIRNILVLLGGLLIGQHLGSQIIDVGYWDYITGGVLFLVTTYFSVKDKTLAIEQKIAAVRNSLVFVGGILIPLGIVSPELWAKISLFAVGILSLVLTNLIKTQNRELKENPTKVQALRTFKQSA